MVRKMESEILEYAMKNNIVVITEIANKFQLSFHIAKKELDNLVIDDKLDRIIKKTKLRNYYIYKVKQKEAMKNDKTM